MTVSTSTYYTVFNAQGTVLRTGAAPEDQIDAQADTSRDEYVIYTKSVIETDVVTNIVVDEAGAVTSAPIVQGKGANTSSINKWSLTANGVDEVIITSIPVNSKIRINMPADKGLKDIVDVTVIDNVAVITTTETGAYTVTLDNGVLLAFTGVINAL